MPDEVKRPPLEPGITPIVIEDFLGNSNKLIAVLARYALSLEQRGAERKRQLAEAQARVRELEQTIASYRSELGKFIAVERHRDKLAGALRDIIKCACVFRIDPLEHCHNAVDHMRLLAEQALAGLPAAPTESKEI